ncbi:MAG: DUF4405 domain-containing protein [Thaumarchaeota archaeon]|nr:DUF4405 domain-containing protein [Candidatus Geocrenenecus arthurdayi]
MTGSANSINKLKSNVHSILYMKLTLRAVIFYLMFILGLVVLVTGLILYVWPKGPHSGRIDFFGLRKDDWRDLRERLK